MRKVTWRQPLLLQISSEGGEGGEGGEGMCAGEGACLKEHFVLCYLEI